MPRDVTKTATAAHRLLRNCRNNGTRASLKRSSAGRARLTYGDDDVGPIPNPGKNQKKKKNVHRVIMQNVSRYEPGKSERFCCLLLLLLLNRYGKNK